MSGLKSVEGFFFLFLFASSSTATSTSSLLFLFPFPFLFVAPFASSFASREIKYWDKSYLQK